MSNEELFKSIKHYEKRLPLKQVFEKDKIFELNSRPQLRSRIQASKSSQLVRQGSFFLPLFSRNLDDQLSSNFHRFVTLCIF